MSRTLKKTKEGIEIIESSDDLIDTDDFKSVELIIGMTNTTTQTEIKDGSIGFGVTGVQSKSKDTSAKIELIEIIENGIKLDVPAKMCSKGHNVVIHIKTKNAHLSDKQDVNFEFSGKIIELDQIDKQRDAISIKKVQVDEHSWNEFMNLYGNRQAEILEFFKAVKGM